MTAAAVTASELARRLCISRQRVAQLLAEGKLEGAYSGSGRDRRFDPAAAARALDLRLDAGRALGNGLAGAEARTLIAAGRDHPTTPADVRPAEGAPEAGSSDASALLAARRERAQIDVQLAHAKLAQESGKWVLADEAARATRSALSAELAQIEAALRDAARAAADRTGTDYRAIRVALFEAWHAYRARRRDDLLVQAEAAEPTAAETAENRS